MVPIDPTFLLDFDTHQRPILPRLDGVHLYPRGRRRARNISRIAVMFHLKTLSENLAKKLAPYIVATAVAFVIAK